MQQAVVDAAIEFCETSLAVTEYLDDIQTLEGEPLYDLDLPSQQQLAQIVRVWSDGRKLNPAPVTAVEVEGDSIQGRPQYYFTREEDEVYRLRLFPAPDAQNLSRLKVRVATKPTRAATQLHSKLYNEYADAIVCGALSRLFAMTQEPFGDAAQALARMTMFRSATNTARIESARGRVVAGVAVQARPFA